ncbi:GNAT family N-acetyltransferase [Jiangella sp. DSM 45060]|uniref:GNAT family N-acetyltransferase n=1 Tax=Jiangella sp. DSM 45060 TaxID=1798224 RepID=UPI00087D9601|nr:GNAT family N-acetyltransferase [Jiangella sp. DSM 45060]SDT05300.1 Protein N-acetyltransferase, RimJ/RimL family [Jiangella sp. DSM 45060]
MLIDHFPIFGLRVRTPRLELRLPAPEELAELADLSMDGIHGPDLMPFGNPWSELPPADRARRVIQRHWSTLAELKPDGWALNLVVFVDGRPVGVQEIEADDFAVRRQVQSESWLGLRHHGQGIGTEMRAAMLHLAFAGLGADEAVSVGYLDNHASLRVSRKLGYAENGTSRGISRGKLAPEQRFLLTRQAWDEHRRVDATIEGLAPCLPLLGAAT